MGMSDFFYRDLLYYPVAWLQAGPVRKFQQVLEQSQFQDRHSLDNLQNTRLQDLLEHASSQVPFYQKKELVPVSVHHINSLPTLLKTDLQASSKELRSTAPLGRLALKTTGGSTGQPVTLTKTRQALAWELAATWRGYSWAGVEVGHRQARFWGVPNDKGARRKADLIDFVCNRLRLSAFSFDESNLFQYVEMLNKKRPRYFYGYVSMLVEFAKFLNRNNLKLDIPLTCVITTSEVLSDPDRELLKETFLVPVFNEYGCGELGTVAHECEAGSMHLSEENMVVEVLDGDKNCAAGEPGELVITELNNFSFPLIRYRTGDFGSISSKPCSCGRTLGVLDSVQGRAYDFIRNRAGQLFHGEFIMYIFEDMRRMGANIRQFQVIQKDLDSFLVNIVPDPGYDEATEKVIAQRIREHVDIDSQVEFDYVETIEREKSGKLRLIKGME